MARNLVDPGEINARVIAAEGTLYVGWQVPDSPYRASYTVHATTGRVIDNHDPQLRYAELTVVCRLLDAAGQHRTAARVRDTYPA